MPQTIYTVEIDGRQYDIEGDRPPTEAEARAAIASMPKGAEFTGESVLLEGRRSASLPPGEGIPEEGLFSRLAGNLADNPLLQRAAQPEGVEDVFNLLIPNFAGALMTVGRTARENWRPIGQALETGGKYLSRYPLTTRPQRFIGDITQAVGRGLKGSPSKVPTPPESVVPYTGASPRLVKGKAPDLEDVLLEALGEARAPLDSRITGLPPETAVTAGGVTRQTGTFPKSGKLGQPGGYSSGRPALTEAQYDDLTKRVGMGQRINDVTPSEGVRVGSSIPAPTTSESVADEILESLGPERLSRESLRRDTMGPRVTKLKAEKLSAEDLQELRNFMGSRRLSDLTGLPVDVIKDLTSKLRRVPDEVQDIIGRKNLPE